MCQDGHLEPETSNLFGGDDFIHSSGIFFISIFGHQGGSGATCKLCYHIEEIDMAI